MNLISCSCCGRLIADSPQENVSYGMDPYPHDEGFGMCPACAEWSEGQFFASRFDVLRKSLNEKNRKTFEAMDYERKKGIVAGLIRKGLMI